MMNETPNEGSHTVSRPSLLGPFGMIGKEVWRFSIFLFSNLFFGLLGVYVALLIPVFVAAHSVESQFVASLRTGGLYTFTIALLSSTAVLLLQGQAQTNPFEQIRRWKISAVCFVIALVIVLGLGAGMQAFIEATNIVSPKSAFIFQIAFFCIGVVAAIYCFLLAIYEEDLDDFASTETAKREQLVNKANSADSDGRGIEI